MAALRSLRLSLQELSRCALWLSARDHQGSRDPEEKSQHNKQTKNRQTDTHKKQKTTNKTNKKTGTNCILIWGNGSWLTTANVNALSSPPTHECLLLSKLLLKDSLLGCVFPGLLLGDPRRAWSPQWADFAWALPSRDHVSPPGAAARPQRSQTSQYRPVAATGHSGLGVVPPCGKEGLWI